MGENCYLQNKSKNNITKTISSVLFLTAMMSYFFYDWIEALHAVSLLKSHIKYSVASPFGAFLSLGICIWAWPAFFVALNYNISINKYILSAVNKIIITFFMIGIIASYLSYQFVNNNLMAKGYLVKTKVTNVNMYVTYTKILK